MRLRKTFPDRETFTRALREYRACPTYWYVPKARSVNDTNISECAKVLTIIANEYDGATWNYLTQSSLLDRLIEEGILKPKDQDSSQEDRNALTRITKILLETLGLLWVFDNHRLVITDVGEALRNAETIEARRSVVQAQIAKIQCPNPLQSKRNQRGFSGIVPHLFLLDVLRRTDNEISFDEFELFVNLAQDQEDTDRIVQYITSWRTLSPEEQNELLENFDRIEMAKHSATQLSFLPRKGRLPMGQTRRNRIHLNAPYQRAFYCYADYLLADRKEKTIRCTSPSTVERMLEQEIGQVKATRYESKDDWFAYMGDSQQRPSWYSHLAFAVQSAKTEEEAREAASKAEETLPPDEQRSIRRLQIEKDIELSYANRPGLLQGLERDLEFQDNQVETPIGRMDLLCKGADGKYVVVEIKAGAVEDAAFGQILRYIGWIHEHFDSGRDNVRGILLASEFPDKARYSRLGLMRDDAEEWLKLCSHGFPVKGESA